MDKNLDNFGEWLRARRLESGLTQEDVGRAVGVSKQHISNIERGQVHYESGSPSRPSIVVVDKLARLFNRPKTEARDAAGYGIGESASLPPSTTSPAAAGDLVTIYLSLPPDQQRTILIIAKALARPNLLEIDKQIEDHHAGRIPQVEDVDYED